MKTLNLKWLWLVLLIVILDQVTKSAASQWLVYNQSNPVFPGFNLTLVHNSGAAFSFLRDAGGWQRYFFIVLTTGISIVLFIWLLRLPAGRASLACALALIMGGATGNLWDRLQYGYVIDFIDVYYGQWSWPGFRHHHWRFVIDPGCIQKTVIYRMLVFLFFFVEGVSLKAS